MQILNILLAVYIYCVKKNNMVFALSVKKIEKIIINIKSKNIFLDNINTIVLIVNLFTSESIFYGINFLHLNRT